MPESSESWWAVGGKKAVVMVAKSSSVRRSRYQLEFSSEFWANFMTSEGFGMLEVIFMKFW